MVFGWCVLGFAQDGKASVFNTPQRSGSTGTVSSLDQGRKVEIDPIVKLVDDKKLEYNLGYLPMDSVLVTSAFGPRKHPVTGNWSQHRGVDLRGSSKDILAVQSGIIVDKGYDTLLGQYVKLQCGSFVFVYGHLKHIYSNLGDRVTGGQVIGRTGGTGRVTADHLHFGIEKSGTYIDPLPILQLIFNHNQAPSFLPPSE